MQKFTRRQYLKISLLGGLFAATLFSGYVLAHELRHGVLRVAFLDVGQGDSIYIESPTGTQFLIDGGPGRSVLARLGDVMPFYDRSIDMIMETHPDHDHSGGLPAVIAHYTVDGLMRTTGSELDTDSAKLLADAKADGVMIITAKRGQVVDLGGGATLRILFPDRFLEGTETNLKAIVSLLSYGKTRILFTSDSPQSVEQYLMALEGQNIDADIMQIGHHGSKTSSALEFIALVDPEFAVLSLGKNNRYGHPNKETLDTLDTLQVPHLRTDEQGTIEFDSDGATFVRVQ